MFYKILRYLSFVFGGLLGFLLGYTANNILVDFHLNNIVVYSINTVFVLTFGFLCYFLFPYLFDKGQEKIEVVFQKAKKTPSTDIIIGVFAFILSIIISFFVSLPLSNMTLPVIGNSLGIILSVFIYVILGVLSIKIAMNKKDEILKFKFFPREKSEKFENGELISNFKSYKVKAIPKILDTSVIIDGRIYDIIKTGFIEGPIIIPMFMVKELQYIADSDDNLRRQKGRRGLDILDLIQKEKSVEVKIVEKDYPSIKEVDHKLLKLTEEYNGKLITNDYNLNKVGTLQKISILNINELALSLKPVVIQGEKLIVEVISAGKEQEQGLGYFDDGTMIVVEDGREYIGKTIETTVTSVIQTPAGKMIFTRKNYNKNK